MPATRATRKNQLSSPPKRGSSSEEESNFIYLTVMSVDDNEEEVSIRHKRNSKLYQSGFAIEEEHGNYYLAAWPKQCRGLAFGDRVIEINGVPCDHFTSEAMANSLFDKVNGATPTTTTASSDDYDDDEQYYGVDYDDDDEELCSRAGDSVINRSPPSVVGRPRGRRSLMADTNTVHSATNDPFESIDEGCVSYDEEEVEEVEVNSDYETDTDYSDNDDMNDSGDVSIPDEEYYNDYQDGGVEVEEDFEEEEKSENAGDYEDDEGEDEEPTRDQGKKGVVLARGGDDFDGEEEQAYQLRLARQHHQEEAQRKLKEASRRQKETPKQAKQKSDVKERKRVEAIQKHKAEKARKANERRKHQQQKRQQEQQNQQQPIAAACAKRSNLGAYTHTSGGGWNKVKVNHKFSGA